MNEKSRQVTRTSDEERQAAFKKLESLAQNRSPTTKWYYELGQAIKDYILQGPTKQRKPQLNVIASEVFGREEIVPTLYSALQFVATIESDEAEAIQDLPWSYVHYLITVKTKRKRLKLVKQARAEDMNVRTLRRLVQEANGGRQGKGKGRPRTLLKVGPASALRELQRICREWVALSAHFVAIVEGAKHCTPRERGWSEELNETVAAMSRVNRDARRYQRILPSIGKRQRKRT